MSASHFDNDGRTFIPVCQVRTDGGTQPRAQIDDLVVDEYSAVVLDKHDMPPVVLYYDGEAYWLADGFHRLEAYKKCRREIVPADVRQGTRRDAVLYSVGANADHGLRRTNADKRRAVETLLRDPEWSGWNDSEVARRCVVGHSFVSKLRPSIFPPRKDEPAAPRKVERNGSTFTMNTASIGSRIDPEARKALLDTTIRDDPAEQKRLRQIPRERQLEVVEKVKSGEAPSVREAAILMRKGDLLAQHPENQAKADASEGVTIEQGDVFDVLSRIECGSVDMIATDWPYNIARHGGGTKVGPDFATFNPGDWDFQDQEEWLEWCHRVMVEFQRVLSPSGSLLMFTDRVLISYLWDDAKASGLKPKNVIVWHKPNAAPNARGNLDSACELALWIVKGSGYTFHRPPSGQCSNVWSGSFVSGPTRRDYPHPTAKPVALLQHYIELFTNHGDLVLDPFGGSGATLEACLRSGRRCHTSDAEKEFVATMAARYRDVAEELGLKAGPPPHEHVYRNEGGQMVCRECGLEMRLDVDEDEPQEQAPVPVTLSDVVEAELDSCNEGAIDAVVHRILMPDGSMLMSCRDHAIRGCMWGREGYEYSLAPAGISCEMCHPETASAAPDKKARLPKKCWWLVRTRKNPNCQSKSIMEHTYREKARTAEEARERILSLPLVVEVLDVRPAENWEVKP